MSPTLVEILFESANLAILAGGLWWLLFRPVTRALADEVGARTAQEAELEQRRAEVASGTAELDARRAAHDGELEAASERQLEATKAEAQALLDAAKAEVEAARKAWKTEQALRSAEAGREVASAAARVSAGAVRSLLARIDGPELELALAKSAVDALSTPVSGAVWVEAAGPLAPEVRALLASRLPDGFEVRERPDLVAGLRIGTAAGLVDCSAAGMAREAAEMLAADLEAAHRG
ncbi:MAG: hypothetical protein H6737_27750 [Alphaproteobacteria bacterium]|nr:hypothetical protein [Alphaproteobacteria bacterium]